MPVWTKGGLRFASRRFLVHNMISSWSIPLSTGHSKPPQEPLRSCSCFVEAQMRIKKNVKVGKKTPKHQTKHTRINLLSPCLLYHCRTSPFIQQPLRALYQENPIQALSPWLGWASAGFQLLSESTDQHNTSITLGKTSAPSLQGVVPETESTGRTPQPDTCNW